MSKNPYSITSIATLLFSSVASAQMSYNNNTPSPSSSPTCPPIWNPPTWTPQGLSEITYVSAGFMGGIVFCLLIKCATVCFGARDICYEERERFCKEMEVAEAKANQETPLLEVVSHYYTPADASSDNVDIAGDSGEQLSSATLV